MVRNILSFFLVTSLICIYGCSNKQSLQPNALYNNLDTLEVSNMIDQYFNYLSNYDYDKALDMLSEIKNDTIRPLLPKTREIYLSNYQTFPVLEYRKTSVEWTDLDPIVFTYDIVFSKSEDGNPYSTKSVLQPIRVNGEWYLMLYHASVIN